MAEWMRTVCPRTCVKMLRRSRLKGSLTIMRAQLIPFCPHFASFKNRELIATITVLADMSTAPAAGVSRTPSG